VGEEDLHGVGGELEFFFTVDAGAPETALSVGPGYPLTVAGVVDAAGGREEVVFRDELLLVGGIAEELRLGIEADEVDAMAGAGGDGGFVAEGAVGYTGCAGGILAVELPEVIVSVAGRLEDEKFSVGCPGAAALRGGIAPSAEDGAGRVTAGGELPEGHGVAEGVDDGEAEKAAVGGPAQPEGTAGKRSDAGGAAIF